VEHHASPVSYPSCRPGPILDWVGTAWTVHSTVGAKNRTASLTHTLSLSLRCSRVLSLLHLHACWRRSRRPRPQSIHRIAMFCIYLHRLIWRDPGQRACPRSQNLIHQIFCLLRSRIYGTCMGMVLWFNVGDVYPTISCFSLFRRPNFFHTLTLFIDIFTPSYYYIYIDFSV